VIPDMSQGASDSTYLRIGGMPAMFFLVFSSTPMTCEPMDETSVFAQVLFMRGSSSIIN